jgi:hypothetical protein
MTRFFLVMAAVAAANCVFAGLTLPPRAHTLTSFADGSVAGILHVHSNRSDGRGSPDEIAATAARVGAKFVVFADHGDATRPLDPPVYRSGVLSIDGVEISTTGGHYIALDMPPSPYPLAGEARDVVEDVRRLGGLGIVAHPDSPKAALRWSAWESDFDAVEWINPDTSWRVRAAEGWRTRFSLMEGLLHYPLRQGETLARLLTGFEETMSRWNTVAAGRRVVGLAGVDSHAKLALHDADPGDNRFTLPLPSYEATFRLLSVHVIPERSLSGDAAADAALLMRALRSGRAYTAVDGFATPAALTFTATNARGTARQGDDMIAAGPITLRVRSNAPAAYTTIIWRGGEVFTTLPSSAESNEATIEDDGEPAVYRVEVRTGGSEPARTWLLSNAIYVRAPDPPTPALQTARADSVLSLFDGRTDSGWHLETDPSSLAAIDVPKTLDGYELRARFGLSGDGLESPWAALVWGTPIGHPPTNVASYDRLTFTGRAERPMRISVQLRTLDAGRALRRWQRSVFLDTVDREHTVRFDELEPSPGTEAEQPPLEEISQILFVVDTTNTKPGTSGRFWIKRAELQK